jgi:HSP20 family protein
MNTTNHEMTKSQDARVRRPQQDATWFTPLVDVAETPEAFLMQADIPGAKAESVDVSFDRGNLILQAEIEPRHSNEGKFLLREYGVGYYYRSFTLDTPIDADGIRAEMRDGVLSLYIPKSEAAKPRKIAVRAA